MVYLFVLIVFIPWPFYKDIVVATSGGGNRDVIKELEEIETGRLLHRFPHNKLASYLSAILSLQSIVLLGIGDDLFDIRWRHKVLIPAFAVIPMLVVYFVDFGVTQMVVPLPLRPYLGELFDLGMTQSMYHFVIGSANGSRLAVLHLYGTHVHFLLEQYQHLSGHQRHRGRPITSHRSADCLERCPVPVTIHAIPTSSDRLASLFLVPLTTIHRRISGSFDAQLVSGKGVCR